MRRAQVFHSGARLLLAASASFRRAAVVAAALVAIAGVVPAATAAQNTRPDTNAIKNQLGSVEAEIRGLQDTKDLIENQAHVLLPGENVLVPPANAANVFVVLLQEGKMQLTEVEAYAETLRRTARTYAQNIIGPQLDTLSRKLETLQTELARQRNPQAGEGIALFPVPLTDWGEVRGELRGSYYLNCYNKESEKKLFQTNGTFQIQLTGDGSIRASFKDDDGDWPADGSIARHGQGSGSGTNKWGSLRWTILFGRIGNRLAIRENNYRVTFTPDDQDFACRPGTLDAPTSSGTP